MVWDFEERVNLFDGRCSVLRMIVAFFRASVLDSLCRLLTGRQFLTKFEGGESGNLRRT